ncbi:Peptidase family M48 [Parasphingorhabdus marina DSM 22363]|uniref:Peptidase family M48 n=1 Tax=Parasphingorhabdus marina DSM 22363 TaxID=1123272 RepID=A0A1N6CU42_9SPHN|nr:M48 family metallopeptidase [Parasphingorhabdus marina]SIN62071.1 Peptidase family M48 [Parasphingorhabdus marina DSM 22363]
MSGMIRLFFAFLLLWTTPLHAQDEVPAALDSPQVEALRALQSLDQRLHQIGYRLITANEPFCRSSGPKTGILLHDIRQYGNPEAARAVFGFSRELTIHAVVSGSPADQAGLQAGDGLIAINGFSLEDYAADPPAEIPKNDSLHRLNRFKFLLEQNVINIAVLRDGQRIETSLTPVPACRSRFEIKPDRKRKASADGRIVSITSTLAEYFESDDEFAAVAAHELAHNLLRHRDRLNAQKVNRGFFGQFGKSAKRIRTAEIEADRLSVWLMANAGYDPRAAIRFWTRYGKEHGKGIFSASTHYRWKKRVGLFEEELEKMADIEAGESGRHPPLLKLP